VAGGKTKGDAVLAPVINVLGVQLKLPVPVAVRFTLSSAQYEVSRGKTVKTGKGMTLITRVVESLQPLLFPDINFTVYVPGAL
jgi:hypothetical protein